MNSLESKIKYLKENYDITDRYELEEIASYMEYDRFRVKNQDSNKKW